VTLPSFTRKNGPCAVNVVRLTVEHTVSSQEVNVYALFGLRGSRTITVYSAMCSVVCLVVFETKPNVEGESPPGSGTPIAMLSALGRSVLAVASL